MKLTRVLGFILACLSVVVCPVWAAGNVDSVAGKTSINRDGQPRGITKGDRVVEGDTIVTGADGEVLVTTDDSGVLMIRPNSRVLIESYRVNGNDKDEVTLKLQRGGLRSISGWISKTAPDRYRVTTPTASVGTRGADHEIIMVESGPDAGVWNRVTKGATTLFTAAGNLVQAAGDPNATGKVTSGDQKPQPVNTPPSVFVQHPLDTARSTQLALDAQRNVEQRLQIRQKQVASAGGLSNQGNPRISSQCTPNSPAQQALDALLRAYEQGNIGFFQQRVDPAMIGFSNLINDLMTMNNVQRQTRLQVLDRQMQCGPDVAVVDFAWEKYYLDSASFRPVVTRGRGSVLISGLAGGMSGQWRISGLVGDNPFRPSFADGSLSVSPSIVSFGATPSGCVPGVSNGLAVATLSAPASGTAFVNSPPACVAPIAPIPVSCIVSSPGFFPPTVGVATPNPVTPSCISSVIGTPMGIGTGMVNLIYALAGSQNFTAVPGSTVTISVPSVLSASGTVMGGSGGYGVSSTAAFTCTVTVAIPASATPAAPSCSPSPAVVNAAIEVRDSDLSGPSVQVQVQASNGDKETFNLLYASPGVYRLAALPITRGAARVQIGSGRIELLGTSPSAVTLTIRYTDAKSSSGASVVRQTTMTLVP